MSKRMSDECEKAKAQFLKIKEMHLAILLAKERYKQDYELIYGGGGIDYSKERVDGRKIETGNKAVEMMVDRLREIQSMEQEYLKYTKLINDRVKNITHYRGKEVLTRRYLLMPSSGRLTSFEQIAEDLGLENVRQCQRIHAGALQEYFNKFMKSVD